MKKFELTSETKINIFGKKLFRIKALISFGNVEAGETGGWVEKEENVNQSGDAWVFDNAEVFDNARVSDNARVFGNARVFDNARVSGNAWAFGNARVSDNARVSGNARVFGNARVSYNAEVFGNARVSYNAEVSGNAEVFDNAWVFGNAEVFDNAWVFGNARVFDNADYATIHGFGTQFRTTTFFRCKDKQVKVSCGCFYGTIPEFREQVKNTRKGKIAEEYLMIADLMEKHFAEEAK
jgi:carbonic anhydrase/acetyltransferase-like protein (isoleucine patch superfamily)